MSHAEVQSHRSARRSFIRHFWERPQQMWARRAIFQVHLWAGILLGSYVIAIGISGSILVFKEELLPRPHITVPHRNLRACTTNQLAQAIETADRTYAGRTAYLASCPDEADPLFAISMRSSAQPKAGPNKLLPDPLTAYIDPTTGNVVGQADVEHSWVHWVDDFHVYLLAGRRGEQWNGIGAGVLLLLVLSGLVIWWPGIKRWKRGFVLDLRRGWKRINWNLHNVTGIWTILFTLTWATTGIYFAWPRAMTAAISRISPVVTASYPSSELASTLAAAKAGAAHFNLLTVLNEAKRISPEGALEGCFYGSGPHTMFTVYVGRGRVGDYANTDFIYFDQASGQHLYTWHRGKNITLGDWLVWLTTPLHFGTSWGLMFKILWAGLGIALPVLTITGGLMYWNRYLSRRLVRR